MAGWACDQYGCLGTLVIGEGEGAFSMNTPAWDLTGLPQLWFAHEVRTDEAILPTAPGRRSYPGRLDQGEYELTLYVNGEVDKDGTPYSDHWMGLYANLQELWDNAIQPVSTGRGTLAATLTLPNGTTDLTADVKFTPLRGTTDIEDPSFVIMRTTLIVPAGRFVGTP